MSLISTLDNRMNPIVVKELRQGLQSWFIIIIVNLLLFALSLTCVLMVMLNVNITEEATGGRDMFQFLQTLLFIATVLGVPLYVLGRLRSERNGNQVDLFFTTTLQPHKIVRGKFVAGMSLVTLLYSVCLPFMLFTYFLRGYDVPTMLFSMAMGYFAAIPLIMLAIVIGSWTMPRIFGPFILPAALAGLIPIVVGLFAITDEFLKEGIQGFLQHEEAIPIVVLTLIAGFLVTKLLEAMAISLLAPPSSNRTVRLRIWMTIYIVVTAICLAAFAYYYIAIATSMISYWRIYLISANTWALISIPCVAIMLLIAICEPDGFSNRIMLQRPRNFLLRLIVFPFTHGASGGFAWAALHVTVILGFLYTMFVIAQGHPGTSHAINEIKEVVTWTVLVFACFSAYVLLAKVVMRLFGRNVPAKHTWAVFLFVSVILLVSSMLICFAIDSRHWDNMLLWKIFNPVAHSKGTEVTDRMFIDVFWALAMLALCVPQAMRDAKRYLFEKNRAETETV